MCIVTQPVKEITNTCIFARLEDDKQYIVYQMSIDTPTENAMILPLPIAKGHGDDAVEFIDLSEYEDFFKDFDKSFDPPETRGLKSKSLSLNYTCLDTLEVHEVGDFEASYVPTQDDFDRLDERFTISKDLWAKLPQYDNYGFAVFKLKTSVVNRGHTGRHTDQVLKLSTPNRIHPMAFSFPTAHSNKIYFPTVHIHDRQVHKAERFDHNLYFQHDIEKLSRWEKSYRLPKQNVKTEKTKGIVSDDLFGFKKEIKGIRPNTDIEIYV